MTGFESKRIAAAEKLQEPDALTIAYQSGFYDGKKAVLAQPAQKQCQKHGECFGGECIYPPAQEPVKHWSDCAVHNGPAYPAGPCDCGVIKPVAMYGHCPQCGAKGVRRERRPNGNDICASGHVYPSREAITAIKKALAQPAQEPIAWITPDGEGFRIRFSPPTNDVPLGWDALYTAPLQREWNFCPRCGKRTNDIHTCTPPQGDA